MSASTTRLAERLEQLVRGAHQLTGEASLKAVLQRVADLALEVVAATVLGYSLPNFWKGMMLILVFSVLLGWLPTSGRGPTVEILGIKTSLLTLAGLKHLILPALNLAIPNMALMIRLVAAGTTEAKAQDYVKYARAKGVRPRRIVFRHILRNILIPVVTVVGIEFGSLIAFSTSTETVFAWPGMGKLLIDSIYQLDRPIVVAYIMLATFLFVGVNLLDSCHSSGRS